MPSEGEGNDSIQRDQATRGWQNQGCQGRSQRRQGKRVATCNAGGRPGLRDVSHGSRATSTIGWGSEPLNGTFEQLEKLAPMLELYTPSTRRTSQQPWIPWT